MKKIFSLIFSLLMGCFFALPIYAETLDPSWYQAIFAGLGLGVGNYNNTYASSYGASFAGTNPQINFNDNASNMGSIIPQFQIGYLHRLGASDRNALGIIGQINIPSGKSEISDHIPPFSNNNTESYNLNTDTSVNFVTNVAARYVYSVTSSFDIYTNIGLSVANTKTSTDIVANGLVANNTAAPSVSQTGNAVGALMAIGAEIALDTARKTTLSAEANYTVYGSQKLSNINQITTSNTSSLTNRQNSISAYTVAFGLNRYFGV